MEKTEKRFALIVQILHYILEKGFGEKPKILHQVPSVWF